MTKEIIIIDDNETIGKSLCYILEDYGFKPLYYETPSEAMNQIDKMSKENLPAAYLVDMRIPKELSGSESFYNCLKEKGFERNFYFMTGHLSLHDEDVQERTGIEVILKTQLLKKLPEILKKIF